MGMLTLNELVQLSCTSHTLHDRSNSNGTWRSIFQSFWLSCNKSTGVAGGERKCDFKSTVPSANTPLVDMKSVMTIIDTCTTSRSNRPKTDDDDDDKPACKYGEKCYRVNPQHLAQYSHPTKKTAPIKDKPVVGRADSAMKKAAIIDASSASTSANVVVSSSYPSWRALVKVI
jgi:hypothetical protein